MNENEKLHQDLVSRELQDDELEQAAGGIYGTKVPVQCKFYGHKMIYTTPFSKIRCSACDAEYWDC
jgi:hypothetical protein